MDKFHTVAVYRQNRAFKVGAGYGGICAASTFPGLLSIRIHLSALQYDGE